MHIRGSLSNSTYKYQLDNSTLYKIYDDRPIVSMDKHKEYVLNVSIELIQ